MVEVVLSSGIAVAVNRQIGPEAEAFGTATSSTVVILKSGSLSSSHLASITSISHSSLSTARQFPMVGIGAGTGTTNGIVETISEIVGMMRESVNEKPISSGKNKVANESRRSENEKGKHSRSGKSGSGTGIEDGGRRMKNTPLDIDSIGVPAPTPLVRRPDYLNRYWWITRAWNNP